MEPQQIATLIADVAHIKVDLANVMVDMREFRADLKAANDAFMALRQDFADFRVEVVERIAEHRAETKADIAAVRLEVADLRGEMRTGFTDLRRLIVKSMLWTALFVAAVASGILTTLAHAVKWF